MGRAGRWIIVAVVALLVLLVVADRVGKEVAERVAGDTLQSSQHLAHRPDVDIAGFPFLTQLAAGNYDKITVTATDVPLGRRARGLIISRLQVVLHDLDVSRSFTHFHAQTASAAATLGFDQLGTALGARLSYAGSGRVEIVRDVPVAGHTLRVRASAKPYLHNGALGFTDMSVAGARGVSGAAVNALTSAFRIQIPLQGIPFDVRLRDVSAGPDGVVVTLAGRDLVYDS
jgi:hypothetical protein